VGVWARFVPSVSSVHGVTLQAVTHSCSCIPYRAWCLVPGPLVDAQRVALSYMTAHALVWGIGGALDPVCWDGFDQAARGLLDGTANYPAGAGTVFDYDLDLDRSAGACIGWPEAQLVA
jgi:hypothetical protein